MGLGLAPASNCPMVRRNAQPGGLAVTNDTIDLERLGAEAFDRSWPGEPPAEHGTPAWAAWWRGWEAAAAAYLDAEFAKAASND